MMILKCGFPLLFHQIKILFFRRVLKRIMNDKEMKTLTTKPNRLWVATKDSQVCGLITILKVSDQNFEFQRLFVKPEFRRLGVATKLIETVISESKKMKGKFLLLRTTNVRKNAAKLYNKLGFEKVKSYRTKIGFIQFLPTIITGIVSDDYVLMLDK
jgi:ribosomal protein S18 acetylase RimI-like enzyme